MKMSDCNETGAEASAAATRPAPDARPAESPSGDTATARNGAPCAFPVPDFDGVTTAFGADHRNYLTREQLGDWYGLYGENSETPFHKCVSGLFYKGGALADYGLAFRPDIDPAKAMRALQALLRSWAPKHEIKVGTVAVALANWCDYTPKATGEKS
jgi:hypothetical protein